MYSLRYRIYVDEMKRSEPSADHFERRIHDAYDPAATIVAAFDDEIPTRAIGTVRFVPRSVLTLHDQEFWRIRAAGPFHTTKACVASKLAIDPKLRRSSLAARVLGVGFRLIYVSGHRFTFVDANETRRLFMESLGFEAIGPMSRHPDYGDVHIMILRMADWDRLHRIRSPFRRVLHDLEFDAQAAKVSMNEIEQHYHSTLHQGAFPHV